MGSVSLNTGMLLIRADAGTQIGCGHVMRCLALAQTCQDAGGKAIFAMASHVSALTARLETEGMRVVALDVNPGSPDDSEQTIKLARDLDARWIVVDGYHFTSEYQRAVKDSGFDLLFIDDNGDTGHFYADIILNQNLHAHENMYPNRESNTRLLLGTRYVLLRREFLKWRDWKREITDEARKILVTLGGSDPENVTLKVIQAMQEVNVDGLESVVVVGASNPHYHEIQDAVRLSRFPIRLENNATNMPELMAWADVAVSGGGSTCWETAFMGLPSMLLVLADNQLALTKELNESGVGFNLGWLTPLKDAEIAKLMEVLFLSAERRHIMSCLGQRLVDGKGAMRVAKLLNRSGIVLRLVQPDDCRLLWEWINDPVTRSQSFASNFITWERHQKWFEEKLGDPMSYFYIAIDENDKHLGQLRFQVENDTATISVSLAPEQRGKGFGSELIRLGSQKLFETAPVKLINAYIKSSNEASVRAFTDAGYVNAGAVEFQNCAACHYLLLRQ